MVELLPSFFETAEEAIPRAEFEESARRVVQRVLKSGRRVSAMNRLVHSLAERIREEKEQPAAAEDRAVVRAVTRKLLEVLFHVEECSGGDQELQRTVTCGAHATWLETG